MYARSICSTFSDLVRPPHRGRVGVHVQQHTSVASSARLAAPALGPARTATKRLQQAHGGEHVTHIGERLPVLAEAVDEVPVGGNGAVAVQQLLAAGELRAGHRHVALAVVGQDSQLVRKRIDVAADADAVQLASQGAPAGGALAGDHRLRAGGEAHPGVAAVRPFGSAGSLSTPMTEKLCGRRMTSGWIAAARSSRRSATSVLPSAVRGGPPGRSAVVATLTLRGILVLPPRGGPGSGTYAASSRSSLVSVGHQNFSMYSTTSACPPRGRRRGAGRVVERVGHVADQGDGHAPAHHLLDGEGAVEDAEAGVHAHDQHLLDPAVLVVGPQLLPLVGDDVPAVVDLDRGMLAGGRRAAPLLRPRVRVLLVGAGVAAPGRSGRTAAADRRGRGWPAARSAGSQDALAGRRRRRRALTKSRVSDGACTISAPRSRMAGTICCIRGNSSARRSSAPRQVCAVPHVAQHQRRLARVQRALLLLDLPHPVAGCTLASAAALRSRHRDRRAQGSCVTSRLCCTYVARSARSSAACTAACACSAPRGWRRPSPESGWVGR